MKFKRKVKTEYTFTRYKKLELNKLTIFSVFRYLLSTGLKSAFLHKTYFCKGLFSKYRLRNVCIFSSRSRNINSNFGVSRIKLRELASSKFFLGLRKTSW